MRHICCGILLLLALTTETVAAPRDEVMATERAFAASMAARDHSAFTALLADEAIFFSGTKVLRGKVQVVAAWAPFFSAPTAPVSWEPDEVEVLDSGNLASSSGPVRDTEGKLIGRFHSIWRNEGGQWRIIFDRGSEVCQ